jgi:DnaJ-class molecular chaperone
MKFNHTQFSSAPTPKPAMKELCPYCAGTGWREQQVKGSDLVHTWRCAFCAGTGWVWTEKGTW